LLILLLKGNIFPSQGSQLEVSQVFFLASPLQLFPGNIKSSKSRISRFLILMKRTDQRQADVFITGLGSEYSNALGSVPDLVPGRCVSLGATITLEM